MLLPQRGGCVLGTGSVRGREWELHNGNGNGNGNGAGEQHEDNRSQPAKYDCSHVWLPCGPDAREEGGGAGCYWLRVGIRGVREVEIPQCKRDAAIARAQAGVGDAPTSESHGPEGDAHRFPPTKTVQPARPVELQDDTVRRGGEGSENGIAVLGRRGVPGHPRRERERERPARRGGEAVIVCPIDLGVEDRGDRVALRTE